MNILLNMIKDKAAKSSDSSIDGYTFCYSYEAYVGFFNLMGILVLN